MSGRKAAKLLGVILCAGIFLTACSGNADVAEVPDVQVVEPEADAEDEVQETGIVPEEAETEEPVAEAAVPAPNISYEILREARLGESGTELAYASYPVFTVEGEGYEALSAAIESINGEWKAQSLVYLDTAEEDAKIYRESVGPGVVFGQSIYVDIPRCDADMVCITISRSVEEGGPHPNNYSSAYNLNARTGETLRLSDVTTVDDALKTMVRDQLYENYPELEFDEAQTEQEISEALDNDAVEWYFWEGQLCIVFKEGSFGFGHAEGSLGVVIP